MFTLEDHAITAFDGMCGQATFAPARVSGNLSSSGPTDTMPADYEAWVCHHGTMEWMETRLHHRRGPQSLWPEAQSVIALGMSYAPAADPRTLEDHPDRARISVYAQGGDYHDVVKRNLKALARWLVAEEPRAQVKVFVDTAPVMEKPLGQLAGIGWQGKHTNLVSRTHGSWLFLGAIYTTLDLTPDQPHTDRCGSCTACQTACPTDAFPAPYQLDARRCISYLTIEHKGPIPAARTSIARCATARPMPSRSFRWLL